jgi:hypothetical protein
MTKLSYVSIDHVIDIYVLIYILDNRYKLCNLKIYEL